MGPYHYGVKRKGEKWEVYSWVHSRPGTITVLCECEHYNVAVRIMEALDRCF